VLFCQVNLFVEGRERKTRWSRSHNKCASGLR
jgi:hypothetical protein